MSELLPENNEERLTKLSCGSGDYDVYPSQATVYKHLGNQAMYDHIFFKPSEDRSIYWWRYNPSDGQEVENHSEMVAKAIEMGSTAFINLRKADERDVNTYVAHSMTDLEDLPPEELQA